MYEEELTEFFEAIFDGAPEGFVYLAFKAASKTQQGSWRREFLAWPDQKERLVRRVLDQSGRADVFFSPTLFRGKSSTKESALGSSVRWVDFDGNAPKLHLVDPAPSIRIKSSIDGHEHWYWKAPSFCSDLPAIERLNRNLAYQYRADYSGWDCNQVLRPPFTHNHKRGVGTQLISLQDSVYTDQEFSFGIEAPEPQPVLAPSELPAVYDVLASHKFKAEPWILFKNGPKSGDRSSGLMALGYHLAEMGISNEEMMAMLVDADERWGKFAERNDTIEQLTKILTLARFKFPLEEFKPLSNTRLPQIGVITLVDSPDIELEWVWQDFLQKAGFLLLTGPPKIGKTQFSLDWGIRAVLGESFLDRPCREGLKIGFLSLEMGPSELKQFLKMQTSSLNEDQKKQLDERFVMIPTGEPYYLNRTLEQNDLEEMIFEGKFDGLIIDSLGSSIEGELSGEKDSKAVMDWSDRMRGRHGCFTWFIHHHRKASGDNKQPKNLSDIYGSYIFGARVTTALTLWPGSQNSISVIPNAVRLAATPDPFSVYRDGNLRFTTKESGIVIKKQGKVQEVPQTQVPETGNFMNKFK